MSLILGLTIGIQAQTTQQLANEKVYQEAARALNNESFMLNAGIIHMEPPESANTSSASGHSSYRHMTQFTQILRTEVDPVFNHVSLQNGIGRLRLQFFTDALSLKDDFLDLEISGKASRVRKKMDKKGNVTFRMDMGEKDEKTNVTIKLDKGNTYGVATVKTKRFTYRFILFGMIEGMKKID